MRKPTGIGRSCRDRRAHSFHRRLANVGSIVGVYDERRSSERTTPSNVSGGWPCGPVEVRSDHSVRAIRGLDHRSDKSGRFSYALQLAKGRSQGEHRRDAVVLHALFSLSEGLIKAAIPLPETRDAENDPLTFVEERLQQRRVPLAPTPHTEIMTRPSRPCAPGGVTPWLSLRRCQSTPSYDPSAGRAERHGIGRHIRRSRRAGVGPDHSGVRARSRRGGAGAGGPRAPATARRRARRTSSRRRAPIAARADRRR